MDSLVPYSHMYCSGHSFMEWYMYINLLTHQLPNVKAVSDKTMVIPGDFRNDARATSPLKQVVKCKYMQKCCQCLVYNFFRSYENDLLNLNTPLIYPFIYIEPTNPLVKIDLQQ